MLKRFAVFFLGIVSLFANYEAVRLGFWLLGEPADVAVIGGCTVLGAMGLIDFWLISKFWRKREAN